MEFHDPTLGIRDAKGNPRNPFPEVPGHFSPTRSPVIRICHPVPAPVPATNPRDPPKSNYFDNFLELFYKKVWFLLYLVVFNTNFVNFPDILSFLTMKIIFFFWFWKKILKKFFWIKNNFKLTSNLKYNTPRNSPNPNPETRGIGFSFPDPRGMKNSHSPIPRIPRNKNRRGIGIPTCNR